MCTTFDSLFPIIFAHHGSLVDYNMYGFYFASTCFHLLSFYYQFSFASALLLIDFVIAAFRSSFVLAILQAHM